MNKKFFYILMLCNIANAIVYVHVDYGYYTGASWNGNNAVTTVERLDEVISSLQENTQLLSNLNELKGIVEKRSFYLMLSRGSDIFTEYKFKMSIIYYEPKFFISLEKYCAYFGKSIPYNASAHTLAKKSYKLPCEQASRRVLSLEYLVQDLQQQIYALKETIHALENSKQDNGSREEATEEMQKNMIVLQARVCSLEIQKQNNDSREEAGEEMQNQISMLRSDVKNLQNMQAKLYSNTLSKIARSNSNNMTDCVKVTCGVFGGVAFTICMLLASNPTLYTLAKMLY